MNFAKFEALASRAVDREFGERVRVEPRTNSRFVGANVDPDRAAFDTTAVVDLTPVIATTERGAAHPTSISTSAVHISFASSALPLTPRQGDRIVALERDDRAFVISVVEPDGMGRVLCRCDEVGEP